MDNETFGSLVRRTRLEQRKSNKDFSLRKFAEKVGLSLTCLSKAETDEFTPPRAETIIKIAEELGIDKYVLLEKAGRIDPSLKEILLRKQGALKDLLQLIGSFDAQQIQEIFFMPKAGIGSKCFFILY